MGVTLHQFFGEFLGDFLQVKGPPLAGQLGMENDVEENVPELLPEGVVVPLVNGLEEFVDLLENHGPKGAVCLLAIPRATFRPSKPCHDAHQLFDFPHLHEIKIGRSFVESGRDVEPICPRISQSE